MCEAMRRSEVRYVCSFDLFRDDNIQIYLEETESGLCGEKSIILAGLARHLRHEYDIREKK
jgi:hypothetical protein